MKHTEKLSQQCIKLEEMKKKGKTLSDSDYNNLANNINQQFENLKEITSKQVTNQQKLQIKAQMLALIHFKSNLPLPVCLINAVRGINLECSLKEYEVTILPFAESKFEKIDFTQPFKTPTMPLRFVKDSSSSFEACERQKDLVIQDHLFQKFQTLKEKVTKRSLSKEGVNSGVELRSLQLHNLQKQIRTEVKGELLGIYNLPQYDEQFERDRRQLEGKRRRTELIKDSQEIDTRKQFLYELEQHRIHLNSKKTQKKAQFQKLKKDLLFYFERKEKIQKEKKAIEEKARIKALKENDSEAYMNLLMNAKEERLLDLLKQTDECLHSLGAQLVKGRGNNDSIKISTKSNIIDRYLENEASYYSIAHKLTEKIEKQPKLLNGQLKEYQLAGLEWLVSLYNNNLNGILADELGLGKTIEAISLITYIREIKKNEGPFLVIAPLSTIDNWYNEFAKWSPSTIVLRYGGNAENRRIVQQSFKKKFNVVLTQYEYASKDKQILKRINWDYIIIDEGHRLKNKDAKLVMDLKQYPSKHRLLLTGTPLQNDLKELWALMNFLLPHVFNNVENFETWFSAPFLGEKLQMNEEEHLLIIQRLHQILRPFLLRREKKDVQSQLPEKVEKVIRCPLSGMQRKLYDNISKRSSSLQKVKGKVKHVSLTNTVMQLRKVCNHPFLFMKDLEQFNFDDLVRASGKFELLDRILPKFKQQGHKILLFSQMTKVLDLLEDYVEEKQYSYLRLDGNVKAELRGQLVKDWNAKDSPHFIFLLSTRAGGLGLNLQSADTVIIFDSDYNPQQDIQAMSRAHRIGQTREVRVFVLVTASPVEEKIYEVAQEKRDAEAKVIKAGMFDQRSTFKQRNEMLQRIMTSNDSAFDAEIPNDSQLNKIIARGEKEFEIFEEMDKKKEKEDLEYFTKIKKKIPNRLMGEDELPEWLKDLEEVEKVEEELGKGKRKRKNIEYVDDENDEFLEDDEEEEEEEEENVESKKEQMDIEK